ncbi:MAG: Uncharacterised protein [Methanobacteriota archaeon]|nr:MAG: Uncharacterised protein [Euryarchaeota archaeon]
MVQAIVKSGLVDHPDGEIVRTGTGGGAPVTSSSITYISERIIDSPISASILKRNPFPLACSDTLNVAVALPPDVFGSDVIRVTYFADGKMLHCTLSLLLTRLPSMSLVVIVNSSVSSRVTNVVSLSPTISSWIARIYLLAPDSKAPISGNPTL